IEILSSHGVIMRVYILFFYLVIMFGCKSTNSEIYETIPNSGISSHEKFSFDHLLNDYLVMNAITDERVYWYINSYSVLRKEFESRKESGFEFDDFVNKVKDDINHKVKLNSYSKFYDVKLYEYDKEEKYFNLVAQDGIGTIETYWNNYSGSSNPNTPGWFKIIVRADMRGWVFDATPEQAMEIIGNNKNRVLNGFVTYQVDKCISTQDSGEAKKMKVPLGHEYAHAIFCDVTVTGIKFFNTNKIYDYSVPYAEAKFVSKYAGK
ncbi:hypothetical protein ACIL2N_003372, partial [Vibrio metschnikovii]